MFCGYGPSGEEFENRWSLSEHALGKLCHSIMQFQSSSKDHQQFRARGQLLHPTEKNVMNLETERHLNSFLRLLGWMPTLDQVNKTLFANETPTLESLPAVRETEDERSLALSAAREDPVPSPSTAATQLLTVTADPLTLVDISCSAKTVKKDIHFNFPSESCTKMMQNRTAMNVFF